ncbi:DUF262 domain-containing protein [Sulfurimonas sp. NW9]|uniref:DUF262 domain-containing protein n=1 Tax=Sulfurimonas sp. NW9 TaxID=2922728 RepID=UPI003DA9F68A
MQAKGAKLSELLGHQEKQFIIPIYQRSYKWTKRHLDRLLEDLSDIEYGNAKHSHFLDSIVYAGIQVQQASMSHTTLKFQVIDGQQRLTTISLLLIVIRDRLKELTEDTEAERLNNIYIINQYAREYDDKLRLRLSEADHPVYEKLVFGDEITPEEKKGLIYKNFLIHKKFISEMSIDELKVLILKFEERIDIIDTFLEPHDNPQKIFSSLNSTGKELKDSDLVKNYVLMNLPSDKQVEFYNRFWRNIEDKLQNNETILMNFLQHYLTMKSDSGFVVTTGAIYETFEKYFVSENQRNSIGEIAFIEKLLQDMMSYTDVYKRLFLDYDRVDFAYTQNSIRQLGIESYYPLVMKISHECSQELDSVYKVIESYLIRRFAVGLPAGKTKTVFAKATKNLDITPASSNLEKKLLEILKSEQKQNRYPNDNEFHDSLKHSPLYSNSSKATKYVLYKAEYFKNTQNRTQTVNYEDLTVEHILPQTEYANLGSCWTYSFDLGEYEKYVHTLGNLTLVTQEKNSQLGNRCFDEKKSIYQTDSFMMTKELETKYSDWSSEEIEKHADEMIDECVMKIWG